MIVRHSPAELIRRAVRLEQEAGKTTDEVLRRALLKRATRHRATAAEDER